MLTTNRFDLATLTTMKGGQMLPLDDATTVWSWRPEMSDDLRRKVHRAVFALAAVVAVSVAVAVLSPARFTIVVSVLIAGLGVFWWLEQRRFRATVVELGSDGTLRVADGRVSSTIDLATVDAIELRLRTSSGQSILSSTPRWTIEIAGPNSVLSHGLAQAVGLFNVDETAIRQLEAELRALAQRLGARLPADDIAGVPMSTHDGVGPEVAHADASSPGASPVPLDDRYEWRPPVSPKADRRRRWFRIGYIGAALLVAVLGASAAWGDWVGVVLSALTVPGLILLLCGGVDYAIGRARRFRIVVEDGVLRIEPGSSDRRIVVRGAKVAVEKRSQLVANGSSTQRTVRWHLEVVGADGVKLDRMFPSLGTTTSHDDYVALERELRRRT